ncbi:hypothetical protein ACQQ2N_02415 [Dokdonella sp. MW10]|uniref:hypothetical protein n=1 Tax=Dokdonella sp. MW10 TaxID=2992926 RepID=UPI003F7FFAF5
MIRSTLLSRIISRRFAAASAVAIVAAVASNASFAQPAPYVCAQPNLVVPQTLDGFYINFLTGTTGTSGGSVPGWDFNPYLTGSALYFFYPTTPANSHGAVATTAGGTVLAVVPQGGLIGPASSFTASAGGGGAANYVNWHAGVSGSNYLGFRFFNETTSAINYGWAQLTTTAPNGFPATLVEYCYRNDGTAIEAGTRPVSLQQFSVD